MHQIEQLARMAWGLRRFLREPMTLARAKEQLRARLATRAERFLHVADRLIYANPSSPYRHLLLWAGCEYGDLERAVRRNGIEPTLAKLRDEGVHVSLEEFKSKTPIARHGLMLDTSASDFDNPYLMGTGIVSSTSGSRSKPTRVAYDWDFMAEQAANEFLLHDIHRLSKALLAVWLPIPPAIAGVHYVLLNAKFRRPPVRWFSHVDPASYPVLSRNRLAAEYIVWGCRVLGYAVPRPEFADLASAGKVAAWMAEAKRTDGQCVLRTYASSAVRVARAALERGLDLRGCVVLTGGEPTERRRTFIESTGAAVFPRYTATESGMISASCDRRDGADDMHIYLDRLAVIQRRRLTRHGDHEVDSFLFSSLSPSSGKVLLNADIGDFGTLSTRPCACAFGELGMDLRVSNVRSHDKLVGEGMSLLGSDLDDIIAQLVERAGGGPDDYQFWETEDDNGFATLLVAISPRIQQLDEQRFIADALDRLRANPHGGGLVSSLWRQAHTLRIVRAEPYVTRGQKLLRIARDPRR